LKDPTKLSDKELVDEFGFAKARTKKTLDIENELKAEIINRDIVRAEGDYYQVSVSDQIRWTLIKEDVIDKLGQDWVEHHSKASQATVVRVSALSSNQPRKVA